MSYFGRRTLYLGGLVVLCLILVGIGGAGFAPANDVITQTKRSSGPAAAAGSAEVRVNVGASWAVGSLLLVYTLIYDITVGPVCYAIVAESSSTRLRQKTIVLARMTYNICGVINNFLLPAQLNPGTWNWGAKTGLFWAGVCVLCIVWCFFRLPETRVSCLLAVHQELDTDSRHRTVPITSLRSYSRTRSMPENLPVPKWTPSGQLLSPCSLVWILLAMPK